MASVADSVPHTVRTAKDPRQNDIYDVTLSRVDQVNSTVRLLRLALRRDGPAFRHLPGQWLDVHIPSIPNAGGFTITSPPSTATTNRTSPISSSDNEPYIELAIQHSPGNPAAAYLWRPAHEILHTPLQVRVGGSFVYPPPALSYDECARIQRAVFVAGGVGINPIMSMLSAMHGRSAAAAAAAAAHQSGPPRRLMGGMVKTVRVLYTTRHTQEQEHGGREKILFYDRIRGIADAYAGGQEVDFRFTLFETGQQDANHGEQVAVHDGSGSERTSGAVCEVTQYESRRIRHAALLASLGPVEERQNTVVYVCGPPAMTDEFVDLMQGAEGMDSRRVLCEKWW